MTPDTLRAAKYTESKTTVRPELLRLLDGLPPPKQVELLNFARFLRQQVTEAPYLGKTPATGLVRAAGGK